MNAVANQLEAVVFDLDGVICHTDVYHYRAWLSVADELGIPFDETVNNRLRGVSRMESLEIILEAYEGEPLSEVRKVDLATIKNGRYRTMLAEMSPADLDPSVRAALDELRSRGLKLAIGSSSRNAAYILERIGLGSYFDAISDGTNISRSKPDPEVFLTAAEYLGVQPSRCVVVEDAIAGIEAAQAAGMYAVAIGDAALQGAGDAQIRQFRELTDLAVLIPPGPGSGLPAGADPAQPIDWARVLPESRTRSVSAALTEVDGRSALRVELLDDITRSGTPDVDYVDMPTFVELPIEFTNGVIEVAILARLNGFWPEGARGFAGLAFHIQQDGPFECVYLRPTNGTRAQAPSPRNERAIQYFAYPDWRFERLRTEQAGVYEAAAPIDINEWTTLRLEIAGNAVRALVNGEPCLTVAPKLLQPETGRIGLFVDIGTIAYFADLRVRPE